jgi:ABC-type microcin C transport system duplicated ATPase subunit YejF
MTSLLKLTNVHRTFRGNGGSQVHAVRGISFELHAGETLGLIGESGSGKSTSGRLAIALDNTSSGTVHFDGVDLAKLSTRELRALRARMQIVFQEPFQSLNPRRTVRQTITEPLVLLAKELSRSEREARVIEVLEEVGLDPALASRYPKELSGGQQQRVGVARAIVTQPDLIVLDEPTSSLDLSIRAHVLTLLRDLQKRHNLAYLFISHDIATVQLICDRIAVMRQGEIVEQGTTSEVIDDPQDMYTQALLASTLSTVPPPRAVDRERMDDHRERAL